MFFTYHVLRKKTPQVYCSTIIKQVPLINFQIWAAFNPNHPLNDTFENIKLGIQIFWNLIVPCVISFCSSGSRIVMFDSHLFKN